MSGLFKPFKKACLNSSAPDLTSVSVRWILIDVADYTVDLTNHDFLNDVPAAAREETSAAQGSKTIDTPEGGVYDGADIVFIAAAGDPCEALIGYNDTPGTEATKELIVYVDGFTVTPAGVDITVAWDNGANRIFKL